MANPDGTLTDEQYGTEVRVQDGDGKWAAVDYNLYQKDDGTYAPKVSAQDVTIDGGDSKEAARLQFEDGSSIAVSWPTALPTPIIKGGSATYKLSATTDLVVSMTGGGVATRIRLNSAPSDDDPIYTLGLRADDVDVAQTASGGLKVTDEDGKQVGTTSTLVAWDAQVDDSGDPVNVVPVEADLSDVSTHGDVVKQDLELRAPEDFLSDPDTQYPVTIDPDISAVSHIRDTWVRSGTTSPQGSSYRLLVGRIGGDSNTNQTASYEQWSNSQLSGKTIVKATMGLYQYDAGSCSARQVNIHPLTSGFTEASTVYTNRPDFSSTTGDSTNFTTNRSRTGCPIGNGYVEANITNIVDAWAKGTYTNYGLRMNVPSDSDNDTTYERRFCSSLPDTSATDTPCTTSTRVPYLKVTYNTAPTVGSSAPSLLQSSGTTTASASVGDSDGGAVYAEFVAKRGTETVFDGFSSSSSAGVQSVALPDLPNGSYTVSARAFDGRAYSAWSAQSTLTVTAKPGQTFISDSAHPALLTTAGVGPLAPGEQRVFETDIRDDLQIPGPLLSDGTVFTLTSSNWPAGGSLQISSTDLDDSDTHAVTMQRVVAGATNVTTAQVGVSSGEIVVSNTSQQPLEFTVASQGWTLRSPADDEGEGIEPLPEGAETLADTTDMVALQPLNDALVDLYTLYEDYMNEGSSVTLAAVGEGDDLMARIEVAQDLVAGLANEPIEDIAPLPDLNTTSGSNFTVASTSASRLVSYSLPIRHSTQSTSYWCGPAATAMAIRASGGPEKSKYNSADKMTQTKLASSTYLATTRSGTSMARIPITMKRWAGLNANLQPGKYMTAKTLKSLAIVVTGGYNRAEVYGTHEKNGAQNPHYNFHYTNLGKDLDHLITGYGYSDYGNTLNYADPVAGRWLNTGQAEAPHKTRSMQASSMAGFVARYGVVA